MNLRSSRGSTSVGTGHGLGKDQGKNGRGDDHGNANRESHEASFLGPPPPPPPPPPMTHAEMMAEMLVARRESTHALEMLAQAIGGFARGGMAMAGTGVVPTVPRGPVPIRTSWGHTRPSSPLIPTQHMYYLILVHHIHS